MPSKASLPSALVDASDVPPQSIDSAEHFSKQSSSRSKLSSNNSSKDEPPATAPAPSTQTTNFMQKFKIFRRKSENNNQPVSANNSADVNSISYRRPSLVVTAAATDQESPPVTEENWLKPSTAPTSPDKSFLKAPSFLKVSLEFLLLTFCMLLTLVSISEFVDSHVVQEKSISLPQRSRYRSDDSGF